jgi:uncharacterized protein
LASAFIRDLATRLSAHERHLDAQAMVFYTPAEAASEMAALVPHLRIAPQTGTDLGERLRAVVRALDREGFDHIILIGSDSPTLPTQRVASAFEALDAGADLAIAGAADGGYVLLAIGGGHVSVFEGIPWSTSAVYAATLERARDAGLVTVELEPWYDVDDEASLARLRSELDGRGEIGDDAPYTREALDRLDLVRRP